MSRAGRVSYSAAGSEGPGSETVDLDFQKKVFNPQEYVAKLFVSFTDTRVREERCKLVDMRDKAAGDLASTVYSNYPKFVNASKEIEGMEGDLLAMRTLLQDVQGVQKQLEELPLNFGQQDATKMMPCDESSQNDPLQELMDYPDDLDVLMSERNYEEAVIKYEEALAALKRERNRVVAEQVEEQLQERLAHLTDLLCLDLQSPVMSKGERRRSVHLLLRLGQGEKARFAFLESGSQSTRREIRQIQFQGDLVLYITELSNVVFSSIRSTSEEYRAIFEDKKVMSEFVVWAVKELDKFYNIYSKQVRNSDDFQVIADCIHIALSNCRQLEKKNLSLVFYLSKLFHRQLIQPINTVQAQVRKKAAADTWIVQELVVEGREDKKSTKAGSVKLTESAKELYRLTQKFVAEISPVLDVEFYSTIVKGMLRLFDIYINHLITQLESGALDDDQIFAVLANMHYLADDLLPRVKRQFERMFKRRVHEMNKFVERVKYNHDGLLDTYCRRRAIALVNDRFRWESTSFAEEETVDESIISVSSGVVDVLSFLRRLGSRIEASLDQSFTRPILSRVLDYTTRTLLDGDFVKAMIDVQSGTHFGKSGVQRFVLDMRALLAGCESFATERTVQAIKALPDKAVQSYCRAKGVQPHQVLPPTAWFDEKIKSIQGGRIRV